MKNIPVLKLVAQSMVGVGFVLGIAGMIQAQTPGPGQVGGMGEGGAPAGEFPSGSGSAIDPGNRTNDQSKVLPRSGSGQGIPGNKSPFPNNNPVGQSAGLIGQSTGPGSNSSQGTGSSGAPPGR